MMKIIIFGTGKYYSKYKKWFNNAEMVALLDNNIDLQGTNIDGVKVFSPSSISSLSYDYIYILSLREEEMRNLLLEYGVCSEKIKSWRDLTIDHTWFAERKPIKSYIKTSSNNTARSILFISDNLERTGGNIAELYMAQVLKECGYNITFVSGNDGPLRNNEMFSNLSYLIDPNIQVERLIDIEYIYHYDMVILNTIYLYLMLRERPVHIPVIWWLHEPESVYSTVKEDDLNVIKQAGLYIFGVSDFARDAFYSKTRKFDVGILPLGEPDLSKKAKESSYRNNKKTVFGVAGVISQIKGQEILLEAIKNLMPIDMECSEFLFAGNAQSAYGRGFTEKVSSLNNANVKYIGELDESKMLEFYRKIDVLIVPSITETLSMTAIEAMMFAKPSIVSTGAGISTFINNKYNGYIFDNKNIDELRELISYCINNPKNRKIVGLRARQLYNDVFNLKSFRIKSFEIVRKIMG